MDADEARAFICDLYESGAFGFDSLKLWLDKVVVPADEGFGDPA